MNILRETLSLNFVLIASIYAVSADLTLDWIIQLLGTGDILTLFEDFVFNFFCLQIQLPVSGLFLLFSLSLY